MAEVLDSRIHILNDDNEIISKNMQVQLEQSDSKEDRNEIYQPPDEWLPITQSRRGNSWTATFHLLCSGIGTQTLSLPIAFLYLGWFWGIMCLSVAFVWQLYTIGVLVSLHESVPGTRFSRYLQLSIAAFGVKLGKLLAIFPIMYLSGGTCVMFIITGGGTMKLFYQLLCGDCSSKHPLTTTEWFLVFITLAILVSLFCANLHSVALMSFLGATMAVGYCTILWIVFVAKGKVDGVVYDPSEAVSSESGRVRSIFNALGIIAVAFRGHNVVLEIQGTMPSTPNRSSSKFMLKGVVASYLIIAMCFFPLAIVGYWAFGNKLPINGGVLIAISTTLNYHMPKPLLGLIYMQIIISCVTAFQMYSMVVYDNLERVYASRAKHECTKLVRMGIRIFFGGLTFFISVAFPFLPSLALIIGGISLHLTFGYPCDTTRTASRPVKIHFNTTSFILACIHTSARSHICYCIFAFLPCFLIVS
ncbi:putative amino acid transporter, transmembrane domain-containing protein [Helianthus annuus]|uniref:Amino acid transporter, transmembrane domain-containing protein n=1 Tax=Helianthus annuus TaxID=4232 RepID=A0A251TL20_HELAN|nr:lysine histidine transporter-like 8 [Helianthus annuus]KAF5786213.1 putative amino acid transporter, transmembrane domain-containing protein [Helianthus annuus]KAJ0879328.1 putative amino acid transporter, transmembrane domain-containing protein [Helianthus annuus]